MKRFPFVLAAAVSCAALSLHALSLEDALDTTGIVWLTHGFVPTTNMIYTYDLEDAAITYDYYSRWIELRVQGPGTIRFRWYRESGSFTLYDNGNNVRYLNVSSVWKPEEYSFTNGEHALRWLAGSSYAALDTVSLNGGTPLVVMYTNFYPRVVTNFFTLTNEVPLWVTNGFVTITNEVPLWVTNGFVTITNGFVTVTNVVPLWITNGFVTLTNVFVVTNAIAVGTFDAAVTVLKPAEGAVISAPAGRGIKLAGIAATSGTVPIISVQASADGGKTWSAGLVSKTKGTWKISDVGPDAAGQVTLRVRAVSASNDVSQATQRHVTINRR